MEGVFDMAITTKHRFLYKRNFMVKLSLSYIVLEFVEERILETEISFEAVLGSMFETLDLNNTKDIEKREQGAKDIPFTVRGK